MDKQKVENTYDSDHLLIPIGQNDEQIKWIALRATRILKRYNHTRVSLANTTYPLSIY